MLKKMICLFLFIIAFAFIFVVGYNKVNADESEGEKKIHLIITNPGADCSTQMNVNWHCQVDSSYLLLSKTGNFDDAVRYEPSSNYWCATDDTNSMQPDSTFYNKRYVCKVSLDNLTPKTNYYYKVVCTGEESDVYHFSTTGITDSWTFTAFTDFQSDFNKITHPLVKLVNSHANNPTLSMCSGDMFDVYGSEAEWQWLFDTDLFQNVTYACSIGDHAYWADYSTHSVKMARPYSYIQSMNNPKNGCEGLDNTTFYFLYNNVLFICLDNGDSDTSSGSIFTNQVKWFKQVVKDMEGKFQYLVVFNHKSIYGSTANDSNVAKLIKPQWYPVFDECKVDVVFSGHDHEYSRTYPLYGNKVGNATKGTYYLDMGSSGSKRRAFDGTQVDALHAKTIDIVTENISCGAVVSVTNESLNVKVYSTNDEIVDEFTVKPKRNALSNDCNGFDSSKLEEELSINYTDAYSGKGVLNIKDTNNFRYVKTIEVISGSTVLYSGAYDSCKDAYSLELENMSKSKSNYLVRVKLFDGRIFEQRVNINYGDIESFDLVFENGKLVLKASSNLVEGVNYTYKLKQNGKSLKSFNTIPYELTNDLLFKDATYVLEVYDENQTLVASKELEFKAKEGLVLSSPASVTLKVGENSQLNWSIFNNDIIEVEVLNGDILSYDEETKTITAKSAGQTVVNLKVANTDIVQTINVTVQGGSQNCNKGINFISAFIIIACACGAVLALGFKKKDENFYM